MGKSIRYACAGLFAGSITGILGSGGGLILIPMLSVLCQEDDRVLFQQSLSIMLPICICSALTQSQFFAASFKDVLPFLVGSASGGCCAAAVRHRISCIWLHRAFGVILFWSGIRCLFS